MKNDENDENDEKCLHRRPNTTEDEVLSNPMYRIMDTQSHHLKVCSIRFLPSDPICDSLFVHFLRCYAFFIACDPMAAAAADVMTDLWLICCGLRRHTDG